VQRLRATQDALRELPQLDPPPGVWSRVAARAQVERDTGVAPRWRRWLAGGAIAAAAAFVGIVLIARSPDAPDQPGDRNATVVPEDAPRDSAGRPLMPATYVALVEESARLERMLARMPRQRPLMSAGTASTIIDLEDRIALIDEHLTVGVARGLEVPQRQVLWRERVDLMNALVQVRYAQAQRTGF
jgi:hypothetical protein